VIVFPSLVLNYMGQAALLITDPASASNPFFNMVPDSLQLPLVVLATLATVIASQAVISGAYSVTHQAIQLGYLPRVQIKHTSHSMAGQIYIPAINWFLACMVAALVLTFESSAAMLPAYGLAVVGTMSITTGMAVVVVFRMWKVRWWVAAPAFAVLFAIDWAYLAAGASKFFEGAWFPVVVGMVIFLLLTTWSKGRMLMRQNMAEDRCRSRSSPVPPIPARPACRAPPSSCRPRAMACPRRCFTTSSTTRCSTSAWWC
jgi:KUP system potassium uptake protein